MSIRRISQNNIASKTLFKAGILTNASLLMLGSGTNGSTNIIDSSVNSLTVTRVGSPVISTASFPTGMSSSINFPGNGNYCTVPMSSLFVFNADFTMECYINWSAHFNFGGLIAPGSDNLPGGWTGIQMTFNGTTDNILIQVGPGTNLINSSITLPQNQWVHVACSRVSGVMRLFFNGINVGQTNYSTAIVNTDPVVYIGNARLPNYGITGYMSNIRIFNTVGLYSSNFTPPPLPLSPTIFA